MADRTDEEQLEAIKAWWRENGTGVIVGIVIGVGALVGWRGWNEYQENQARAAAQLYQEMLSARASNDTAALTDKARQLQDDYGATPYAGFASLNLARQAVSDDDLESAERHLRSALDSFSEPSLKHVTRLRLLQVLSAREQYDTALALLDKTDPGEFTGAYAELRGDILLARGQTDAARDAYRTALNNSQPQSGERELLQMKLDGLGTTNGEAETP